LENKKKTQKNKTKINLILFKAEIIGIKVVIRPKKKLYFSKPELAHLHRA